MDLRQLLHNCIASIILIVGCLRTAFSWTQIKRSSFGFVLHSNCRRLDTSNWRLAWLMVCASDLGVTLDSQLQWNSMSTPSLEAASTSYVSRAQFHRHWRSMGCTLRLHFATHCAGCPLFSASITHRYYVQLYGSWYMFCLLPKRLPSSSICWCACQASLCTSQDNTINQSWTQASNAQK